MEKRSYSAWFTRYEYFLISLIFGGLSSPHTYFSLVVVLLLQTATLSSWKWPGSRETKARVPQAQGPGGTCLGLVPLEPPLDNNGTHLVALLGRLNGLMYVTFSPGLCVL